MVEQNARNCSLIEVFCVRAIAILAFAAIAIAAIVKTTDSNVVQMSITAIVTILIYSEYKSSRMQKQGGKQEGGET
jgi:hypothetical protein